MCCAIDVELLFLVQAADIKCCLGQNNMSYDLQRSSGPPPSMHKPSGTIDVIGSSARDTRRPLLDFHDSEQKPDLYATVWCGFIISLRVGHYLWRILVDAVVRFVVWIIQEAQLLLTNHPTHVHTDVKMSLTQNAMKYSFPAAIWWLTDLLAGFSDFWAPWAIGFIFGMRKLEWLGYNLVKVVWWSAQSFEHNTSMWWARIQTYTSP